MMRATRSKTLISRIFTTSIRPLNLGSQDYDRKLSENTVRKGDILGEKMMLLLIYKDNSRNEAFRGRYSKKLFDYFLFMLDYKG